MSRRNTWVYTRPFSKLFQLKLVYLKYHLIFISPPFYTVQNKYIHLLLPNLHTKETLIIMIIILNIPSWRRFQTT